MKNKKLCNMRKNTLIVLAVFAGLNSSFAQQEDTTAENKSDAKEVKFMQRTLIFSNTEDTLLIIKSPANRGFTFNSDEISINYPTSGQSSIKTSKNIIKTESNTTFSSTATKEKEAPKENKPKVKNVMGKDKNFSIGLTVELSKPNITVRINSDLKDPIYILSIKFDTTYKDIALITINSDTFFIFNILSFKALNIYKYYRVL